MKNIFLTGAAGFIGSRTARALLNRGYRVVGLDNFDGYYPRSYKEANIRPFKQEPNFSLIEGDIRNPDLHTWLSTHQIDAVIHLAARAGVRPSIDNPPLYADVNVNGTTNILYAMQRLGLKKLIYASSSSVYGDRNEVPFSESDRVEHPISPYAATKRSGELMCYNFHHLYGMDISCLRFFTVYGPGQRPEMAIHKFIRRIRKGLPLVMYGDGSSARDYTYIDDIVDGLIKALGRLDGFNIYNLGNSHPVALKTLVEEIKDAVGTKVNIKREAAKPGDVSVTYANTERARRELDYQPDTLLTDGLRKFMDWFNSQENWILDAVEDEAG